MYRYVPPFLFLILLFACSTDDESGPQDSAIEAAQIADIRERTGSSGTADDPGREEESFPDKADWLARAEKAWFAEGDPDKTDYCLDRVDRDSLIDESRRSLYQLLCRKVYTKMLPLGDMGFEDRNISALYLDRDDLWMGTWTGGIARYSLPLNDLTTFRESRDSLRVEKISDFEGWGSSLRIAGYSDIYRYEKRTSLLERAFPEEMERVNNLSSFGGHLYASTVNKGLWMERGNGEWSRIGRNIQGINRINTLFADSRGNLLIGTAANGIITYDGKAFRNYRDLYPSFTARNITAFAEMSDVLLVGTYGEGAFLLNREDGRTIGYSEERGDFSSDYVLCIYISERWFFAGTLGGGLYAMNRDEWNNGGAWIPLGLDEGLNSLDAAALVGYDQSLYISLLGQGILIMDEEIIEKAL